MTTRRQTKRPAQSRADADNATPARADDAAGGAAGETAGGAGGDDARELFVLRAGGRLFAVYAEEVESVAERLRPAPLPFAPPTVLGVVPVRGRMRTALDPLRLDAAPASPNPTPRADDSASRAATKKPAGAGAKIAARAATKNRAAVFVALAGDEQLALACDAAEGRVAFPAALLERPPDAPEHVRALFAHEGRPVTLLDPARLFDAAMRGTDRRRRRS